MPSLLSRVRNLVVAEAHHAVDEAENPQVMSHQLVRDLTDEMQAAHHSLVASLAAERRVERSRERMVQQAAGWESKAEALLRSGKEALAREALARAVLLRQGADALQPSLDNARRMHQRMRTLSERLRGELERVRHRVAVIDVQHAAASAVRGMARADDAYTRALERAQELDRHERKSAALDSEAEAAAELLEEQDGLERAVAQHEMESAVDEALSALHAKLAGEKDAGASVSVTQVTVTETKS